MAYIIQTRRDTAANWTSANPILAEGERGLEIDTFKEKIGNGIDAWIALPYVGVNIQDSLYLGSYATESALTAAHPTAIDGNYAIVQATDTVWIWDIDTTAWVDSGSPEGLIPINSVGLPELKNEVKDNILWKDNTEVYVPTLDYHPMTLKYFSDNLPPSVSPIPLSYSVTWTGTGLVFDCTASRYYIVDTYYSATAVQVTLDAADVTYDRIDLFVANTSGVISKITGVASASPVEPNYDLVTEFPMKFVLVKAGETVPSGISNVVAFAENLGSPTEFDFSANNSVFSVQSNDAHIGTESIECTNMNIGDYFTLTSDTLITPDDMVNISFWIKFKASIENSYIAIRFFNNLTNVGEVHISDANGDFEKYNYDWQKINILKSAIPFNGQDFDSIRFSIYRGFAGVYVDEVILQIDTDAPIAPTYDDSDVLKDSDTISPVTVSNKLATQTELDDKVDKVTGYSLTKNDLTDALKMSYDGSVLWIGTYGSNLTNHLNDVSNPHSVTKTQVGLSEVPNTDFTTAVSLNTAKETNATHTGDVTGSGVLTIADGAITVAKLATRLKGSTSITQTTTTLNIDLSLGIHWDIILQSNVTSVTFSNATADDIHKMVNIEFTGDYTVTIPSAISNVTAWDDYDGTLTNQCQLYIRSVTDGTTITASSTLLNW